MGYGPGPTASPALGGRFLSIKMVSVTTFVLVS